jgi:hypothetical protein
VSEPIEIKLNSHDHNKEWDRQTEEIAAHIYKAAKVAEEHGHHLTAAWLFDLARAIVTTPQIK